ncbi:MAG: hypothetical protein ACK48D_13395 [Pseudanabaena sp.]|jgi:hypothetical protein
MGKSIKRVLIADIASANILSIKNIIQLIAPSVDVLESLDGKQALGIIKVLIPELIIVNKELSIFNAYEISRFATNFMTERELTIDGYTVCRHDNAYEDRSVIIYSDKEVFEYDLYWALKGTLAYNIVSIQHGFSGLEENIKRFFDGCDPYYLYS